MSQDPQLSVVIIGRNEGERLVRCIESVRAMRMPGAIEILYVDSESNDGSPERAATLGAQVLSVRPERPCASVGRNAGWRAARAPFVLFLDGDTVLEPDFVSDTLPEFGDPQVAVVWGHRRELRPEASVYNRVLDLDWVYPAGPSEFCGGDALMRRSVLEEVGGYDETLIAGEEPEMCSRIRLRDYVILHVDRAMTGHDLAITRWSQYWWHAVRAGHAYAEIAARTAGTASPLWAREARGNLLRSAVLLGPLVAAGVLAVVRGEAWPILVGLGLPALLVARTARSVGWKSRDPITRLVYAIHSHLQQIPISTGQLLYHLDRLRNRRRGLIEYKEGIR